MAVINVRLDAEYFYPFSAAIKRQKDKSNTKDEFPIEKFRDDATRRVPKPSEIVRLAAIIAAGKQINPQSGAAFAAQALDLWEASEEQCRKKIDRLAMSARLRAIQEARRSLPRPAKFPAPLDEVLKLLMPQKRREDRMKCYREFIREKVEVRVWQEKEALGESAEITPVGDQIEKWISEDISRGFKEHVYDFYDNDFRRWLPKYEAENRRNRARAGAEGLKIKRKKNGQTKKS